MLIVCFTSTQPIGARRNVQLRPSGAQSADACSHYDSLPTNVIRHAISADDSRAI